MPRRSDRLTPAARRLIERAAELRGVPLTAFAVQALVERAQEVVEQTLDDDPVAPALAKAVRRSRER